MYVYVCIRYILFILSSIDRLLGCLHLLTVMNNAAENISVMQYFL
jgi:hypothetical protein